MLQYFDKYPDVELVPEPVAQWCDVKGHNLLGEHHNLLGDIRKGRLYRVIFASDYYFGEIHHLSGDIRKGR